VAVAGTRGSQGACGAGGRWGTCVAFAGDGDPRIFASSGPSEAGVTNRGIGEAGDGADRGWGRVGEWSGRGLPGRNDNRVFRGAPKRLLSKKGGGAGRGVRAEGGSGRVVGPVGWESDGLYELRGYEGVRGGVWAEHRGPGRLRDLVVPIGCPTETTLGVYAQGLAQGHFESVEDGCGLETQPEKGIARVS
jgi:hypothetical protein